ncbi:MAG TPA: HEPN domain-containing protein [Gammaproteobacteria bacterium]
MHKHVMKAGLDHLSQEKQCDIARVADVLKGFEQIEMLILFGSYARGDYVDDPVGRDDEGPYYSDVDICVIVKSPRQQRRIERSNQLREKLREVSDIRVSLIAHTIRQFNRALENVEYFYVDVVKDGVLLHDSETSRLSKPKNLTDEQRRTKAKEDHEFWTEQADDFLGFFEAAIQKSKLRKAAFFLHQASENFLTAACLVLSGYRPKGHDLVELETWCTQFDPAFKNIFPKETDEDRRLLELLRAAYVGARYKKSFVVTRADLEALLPRVESLSAATRMLLG